MERHRAIHEIRIIDKNEHRQGKKNKNKSKKVGRKCIQHYGKKNCKRKEQSTSILTNKEDC